MEGEAVVQNESAQDGILIVYDSSPRDPKQGERGKIGKFNKIRPIFGFFAKMELGASR